MEQNNIENIVLQTVNSKKVNNPDSTKLITDFKTTINQTFGILEEANKIDVKNNNGFTIELNTLNTIIDRCLNEKLVFGTVNSYVKNEQNNCYYGKEITSVGTVCILFDGNTYTLLELALRNIIANNNMIFSYNGYMFGTNGYLFEVLKETLNKNNMDPNQINYYLSDNPYTILKYYTNIDLVLGVGPRELQNKVLKESNSKVLTSGYENFDLYIESLDNMDFINKILAQNLNINVYIYEELDLEINNATYVSNIDEAIALINNTGSKYSSSIFTSSNDSADQFIKEIKSHQVLVNTSPTIERVLDINQTDLSTLKTIIYPEKRNVE